MGGVGGLVIKQNINVVAIGEAERWLGVVVGHGVHTQGALRALPGAPTWTIQPHATHPPSMCTCSHSSYVQFV